MENLLSIIGADNLDKNATITQDHIDQLYGGVTPLLEKFFEDNPLECNADCHADLEDELLFQNYTEAKATLANAPDEFENAEKAFYTYSQGGAAYINFKEGEAAVEVDNIGQVLSNNFEQKVNEIQNRINSLESQTTSEKYLEELGESYGRDINQIDQEINNYQKKNNVNDRLAVYYNRRVNANKKNVFYFRVFYWALLMFYFFYFYIFQTLYLQRCFSVTVAVLLLVPIFIKPLITWLFPIKIYIPPAPPVCPTKPASKVGPPIVPPPFTPPKWTPPPPPPQPLCPAPTFLSILRNSLPNMGIPNARQNISEKASNFEDVISFQMTKMADKFNRIM
jgi:hypothetical protein